MAFVAAGAALAGAATSAYGAVKSGEAANDQAQGQASLAEQNAVANDEMGHTKLVQQQRDAARSIGAAQAQYSASGIDISQGSALDVITQSAQQAATDSAQIQYETYAKTQGFKAGAANDLAAGSAAQAGGYYSAAGSLLGGAATAYGITQKAGAPDA